MTDSKSLPPRPSLDSLRKQAKKLARDRAISLRDAQLVLARDYGYAGWQDLTAEVSKRLGRDLEWAVGQARRVIHDNDVERLKQLVAEYPALLSWRADKKGRGVLGMATSAYAFDVGGNPQREQDFTRAACAELLIDAGAIVAPSVCENILQSRAGGLLALFQRKGLLPRTLKFFAALGDIDAVRSALDEDGNDPAGVNEAFVRACLFAHQAVASLLLERALALDRELGERVDQGVGRSAFIRCFVETRANHVRKIAGHVTTVGLWKTFAIEQVSRSVESDDVTTFVSWLRREPWLLSDAWLDFQNELMGCGRAEFIAALLDLDPAILQRRPPPPSHNIEYALVDAKADLVPLLTRIWPIPDDLPHAAGMGDLARVQRWFDAEGKPALGDIAKHAPATSVGPWDHVGVQQVLDTALAWAVINRRFDVADFLLDHGADINTNWNSHEPASILHLLVFLPNPYESMQYLIDRGIDMTIKDYRWNSNAVGWARYGNGDEKMAQWLEEAERRRETKR
jgi:hypothetical protein